MHLLGYGNEPDAWGLISRSIQASAKNISLCYVAIFTTTGSHMWINGTLNHYFKPNVRSIQDIAINVFSGVSAALLGEWVSEQMQYEPVPLGFGLRVEWLGLLATSVVAIAASRIHHTRDDPLSKAKKT